MTIEEKLVLIAENMPKVHQAGEKSEYDKFWDNFQNYGKKTTYSYCFSGTGWNMNNFKPKYDLGTSQYKGEQQMHYAFYKCTMPLDLIAVAEETGVNLGPNSFNYESTYEHSAIVTIPVVNVGSGAGSVTLKNTFYNAYNLHTIGKIILLPEASNIGIDNGAEFNNTFYGATKLQNIQFENFIKKSISFSSCPLSVESCKNIIEHLYNFAGTTNELKYKLTLKSTCWTALNETEAPPSGETWQEYVTSLGWNYA